MNGQRFENIKMVGGEPQLNERAFAAIHGITPGSEEALALRVSEDDIERWREECVSVPPLRFDPLASYRQRRTPIDVVRPLPGVSGESLGEQLERYRRGEVG